MADHEYPTVQEICFIENYNSLKEPVKDLLDFIYDIWWMPSWGWKQTEFSDKLTKERKIRLYLSTGGWSGNEDIINALKKNKYFWFFYWYSSRRGGHYIFEFSKERFDR